MDDVRESPITGTDALKCAAPESCGFDPQRLRQAVEYVETEAETPWPRDLSEGLAASGRETCVLTEGPGGASLRFQEAAGWVSRPLPHAAL